MMIYEWTRQKAEKEPESVAVTYSNRHLTYGQLESDSNKLAGMLLSADLTTGKRIGLLMEKSPDAITAMHAISKTGAVFVPININSPVERIDRIICEANIECVMIDHHGLKKFRNLRSIYPEHRGIPWSWWSPRVLLLQDLPSPLFTLFDMESQADLPYQSRNDDRPAVMIFNSGISGQFEADIVTHKNISVFIEWAYRFFDIEPEDRMSGHSPFHFELSLFDLFGTFAAGAHLYLIPSAMTSMPYLLSEFILENDLTQWVSVPSVLSYMASFDAISENGYPGLERLIWVGGKLPEPARRYWMDRLPGTSFTHLYTSSHKTAVADSYPSFSNIPVIQKETSADSYYREEESSYKEENSRLFSDSMDPVSEGIIPVIRK